MRCITWHVLFCCVVFFIYLMDNWIKRLVQNCLFHESIGKIRSLNVNNNGIIWGVLQHMSVSSKRQHCR